MAVPGRKAGDQFSFTTSQDSGEDYEIFCQPCDRDDLRLPAFGFCTDCEEHLCESCFKHHKKATTSRHHILLDKHNMPQTLQVPSKSVHTGPSDDVTKPCPKHTQETIKYYCNDHKALLCSVCVKLDHSRTSCQVNCIPDISQRILNSKELREMLEDLNAVTERYKKTIATLKEKITSSNKSLIDVLADIKKFRQDINKSLDELEKEAIDKAKAIQQENSSRLKRAESTCDEVIKSMKASSESVKQLNNSKQADRLFMELRTAEMLIKDNEKKLTQQQSSEEVRDYNFKPNPELISFFQKVKLLGILTIKQQFTHQADICVKTSRDRLICLITGMVLLTPYKLILTDSSNNAVKMLNLYNNTITDQLQLGESPWDITSVTSDQVAVTLPDMKTIHFISATSTKLSLKHKLKVDGDCWSISCHQNKLVVTFSHPPKLEIIDLKGKVLKTIKTDVSGRNIFRFPSYVKSNSRSIYVSDEWKHAVIMLNWQGELTGSYAGMGVTAGIAVLEDGSILVSDRDKGTIHHMSGDLTSGYVVLKNLENPFMLCWCGTNSKLYTSHYNGINDNSIQIFKKLEFKIQNH